MDTNPTATNTDDELAGLEPAGTYHPSIDAINARLSSDDTDPATLAILAAGRDIARQLGRLADHVTIEQLVAFGRYPAGHPANDPHIATKSDVREHKPMRRPALTRR